MQKQFEDFLSTYKLQKPYLDRNDIYTMDGKNFIDWYIKESGNVKKINISEKIDYETLAKNLAKENSELKLHRDYISGSLPIEDIKKAIKKFKKEELPDAESPYHHEAEIWSGMQSFIRWLDANK